MARKGMEALSIMVAMITTTETEERADAMPWLCEWDAIYGIYPPEKAWRPDSEAPVITVEGHKICQRCAQKYWDARNQAEREAAAVKARVDNSKD